MLKRSNGFGPPEYGGDAMDARIVPARRYDELLARLEKEKTPFVPLAEERVDPRDVMPGVKSILVAVLPYDLPKLVEERGVPYRVSASAYGGDYHAIVRRRLEEKLEELTEGHPGLEGIIQVDTGPLVDRHLAHEAGLGFFGKNRFLIHPQYGTRCFIGLILLSKDLSGEVPEQVEEGCGDCTRCLGACPSQALSKAHGYRVTRCIAYLTQKKRGLTEEERMLFDGRVYGCDTCQQVCPYNDQSNPDPVAGPDLGLLDPEEVLFMSNRTFQEAYGHHAFAWVGASTIKRNLLISAVASQDPRLIGWLDRLAEMNHPVLEETILWARAFVSKMSKNHF